MAHRRRRRWNRTYARYNKVPSQQYPPSNVTETVSNFGENNIQIPVVKVSSYCQTENEQSMKLFLILLISFDYNYLFRHIKYFYLN